MKNQFILKHLISKLTAALIPMAGNRHSFFINDVAPDIQLSTDQDILASVLSELFQTAVNQTENDCIRISASIEHNLVFLNVHENGPYLSPEMSRRIQMIQPLAIQIGGSIAYTAHQRKGQDLAIRFLNN